jgi:anti-sigma B factor antagonist
VVKVRRRRLDGEGMQAVAEQLRRLIREPGRQQFDLDLSDVTFVSASGLGQLVGLHKRLQGVGGRLTLCNVDRNIYPVFEATRLTTLLDIRRVPDRWGALP